MIATNIPICTHPILKTLHLSLPLKVDTSWTYWHIHDPEEKFTSLRITLGAGHDLIIEILEGPTVSIRYVFDVHGNLVSAHRNDVSPDPLFADFGDKAVVNIQQRFPFNGHGREEFPLQTN